MYATIHESAWLREILPAKILVAYRSQQQTEWRKCSAKHGSNTCMSSIYYLAVELIILTLCARKISNGWMPSALRQDRCQIQRASVHPLATMIDTMYDRRAQM